MIEEVKRAIKNNTFFPKTVCYALEKMGLSNRMLQALQVRYKTYTYLRKRYGNYLETINYPSEERQSINKNIWICWLQGEEKAPKLVRICIDSVRKFMPDYNLKIITSQNVKEYIQFPEHISQKWTKGSIPYALMSDIIRTELLIRYGGLWLDATVLLTAPIPEYVFEKELFMYTHSYPDDITMTFNSWLIYSTGNNRILKTVRDLLYEYWKREKVNREYFIWHLFMTMSTEKYLEDALRINYITDELPETLARIIFRKYDELFWKALMEITPVHKLSNKFRVPENWKGTYYEKLIQSGTV